MGKKKRIAVIGIRGFPFVQGGVESHCQLLMPLLSQVFDVEVFRRKPYLSDESRVEMDGIDFIDLPSTRIKGFEAVFHTLLSVLYLTFHRVDCVNVHNIGPGLFIPYLRLLGYPVVLTYHSPNYEHAKWGSVARWILRLGERLSLKFASSVIFVSPFQREKYPKWVLDKSEAVPNGISVNKGDGSGAEFLKRIGAIPGKYILAVGRLTPEKGFETLVEAVQGMPEVEQLIIAGDSDHDPNARQRLASLDPAGKVVLPGYTTGNDLTALYANARMFALSSYSEGFPLVLLEAMSFGLPIVASDIPASHIIELPSEAYAKPGNAASFRKAIGEVIATGVDRRKYDLREYDWTMIARRTAEIYEKVLAAK